MQELDLAEINAISGGAEGTQTVTVSAPRMPWYEKLWYDLFG